MMEKFNKELYKKEEHFTVIREPGSDYIGHLSPASTDANGVARKISEFSEENCIGKLGLGDVGSFGNPTNTGKHNGIILTMTPSMDCQLHGNKLLLTGLPTVSL